MIRVFLTRVAAPAAVLSLSIACGSAVTENADATTAGASSGSGGSGGSGGGGGGGSGGGCAGSLLCAHGCGSDWLDPALCQGGVWVCPPDTVDPAKCPPGTCWGLPFSCEVCTDAGWSCEPNPTCVGSSCDVVCAGCPSGSGPAHFNACICDCDASGSYTCETAPGCCTQDFDCGDEQYVPCVNYVCKQPVANGCWSDAECPAGTTCEGESVCPCDSDCDGEDQPGACL